MRKVMSMLHSLSVWGAVICSLVCLLFWMMTRWLGARQGMEFEVGLLSRSCWSSGSLSFLIYKASAKDSWGLSQVSVTILADGGPSARVRFSAFCHQSLWSRIVYRKHLAECWRERKYKTGHAHSQRPLGGEGLQFLSVSAEQEVHGLVVFRALSKEKIQPPHFLLASHRILCGHGGPSSVPPGVTSFHSISEHSFARSHSFIHSFIPALRWAMRMWELAKQTALGGRDGKEWMLK